jgi:cobalamin synthase
LGGLNGDAYGASVEISEILLLLGIVALYARVIN